MSADGHGTELDVTVLMPVHAAVAPEHLRQALHSIGAQSGRPREVVIVLDGPVSRDHEMVLDDFPRARTVRLHDNVGTGRALAAGLDRCTSTWVARADSDDLSEPSRLVRQLEELAVSRADVCSAAMIEFDDAPDVPTGLRPSLVDHLDFTRLMPRRNPVHHPTAVFRRDLALAVGGYAHLPYLEDYDLWARMLRGGARFVGVAEPLVRYRTSGMLARRTSAVARRSDRELQRRLRDYGLVSARQSWTNRVVRGTYLHLPAPLLDRAYRTVFVRGLP